LVLVAVVVVADIIVEMAALVLVADQADIKLLV
jgi:hypothetical protein